MNINGHSSNFFRFSIKKGRQCDIADVIAIHYINMVKIRFLFIAVICSLNRVKSMHISDGENLALIKPPPINS